MDKIGPATLQRIKAIRSRVEEVGRVLNIPEEQALKYVEIDTQQQLVDGVCSLHDDGRVWRRVWRKALAYLNGLLKAESESDQG